MHAGGGLMHSVMGSRSFSTGTSSHLASAAMAAVGLGGKGSHAGDTGTFIIAFALVCVVPGTGPLLRHRCSCSTYAHVDKLASCCICHVTAGATAGATAS